MRVIPRGWIASPAVSDGIPHARALIAPLDVYRSTSGSSSSLWSAWSSTGPLPLGDESLALGEVAILGRIGDFVNPLAVLVACRDALAPGGSLYVGVSSQDVPLELQSFVTQAVIDTYVAGYSVEPPRIAWSLREAALEGAHESSLVWPIDGAVLSEIIAVSSDCGILDPFDVPESCDFPEWASVSPVSRAEAYVSIGVR